MHRETQRVRPFVHAAVLRGMTFDAARYDSFIALQDKLHHNIARKRTLVAIGTYDLSKLSPPFTYEARAPEDIRFQPLGCDGEMDGHEIMEYFRTDVRGKHIKPYTDIIADSDVYPVIYDSEGTVLSLPPLINGESSKITLETRDVLIETTSTDKRKAEIVLNTMVCLFSQYAAEPFTVEQVEVTYEHDGSSYVSPDLSTRDAAAPLDDINVMLGTELSGEEIVKLLQRMMLPSSVSEDGKSVVVAVPPTRSDILHARDVVEDVAIAYGYNNITKRVASVVCEGYQLPLNKLSDKLRMEMAAGMYTESLTMGLCSKADVYDKLRRADDGRAVVLRNPKTADFQVARTTLLPGLLKTLAHNKAVPRADGLRVFEVSDVLMLDDSTDVGSRNERHLCAVYTGPTDGFALTHGLADRLMAVLAVAPRHLEGGADGGKEEELPPYTYSIAAGDDPAFFAGRCVDIFFYRDGDEEGVKVGSFGTIHPEVLSNFDLDYPASALELNVQAFLDVV
eukprot:PLAT10674.1.p2 GENE.PLAT10674.1~~PLAT10674.1.p2  ORF type:complete len:524 (+),score=300.42 PLAT10674.1:49-1572(+)